MKLIKVHLGIFVVRFAFVVINELLLQLQEITRLKQDLAGLRDRLFYS